MDAVSRKGWSAHTLARLGVVRDYDRWCIPTATGTLRYADNGAKPKMIAPAGSHRELWPAPEDIDAPVLFVVEGEPDAISATELGFPAVALPGAGKFDERWPGRLADGRKRVVLIGDCDSVGRIRMRSVAEKLSPFGVVIHLVDLAPERDDGYDLGDLLVELGRDVARTVIEGAVIATPPYEPELPPVAARLEQAAGRLPEVHSLGGITPTQAEFLWYPYLPLGKVVIVAGAPGHGKSQFAALIAAMASRGQLSPGDVNEPSRVLMLCAEDDLDDTVVPRLLAVNADLRMIDTIDVVTRYPGGLEARGMIRLPGEAGVVHEWAQAHANARLVVMDPVASFFERKFSTFVNQDVRDAFGPMIAIAQRFGITIVIILHLNKSETKDFTARIAESHGFQALARSVLALGPDPDDREGERGSKKVIAVTKANLIKPGSHGQRCEIRSVTLSAFTPPIETSELVLTGKCDITADDLLMGGQDRTQRLDISEWLEEVIGDGWVKVADVQRQAKSDGWSWAMVDRIARARGYQRSKADFKGPWWMGAPKAHHLAIPGSGDSSQPSQTSEGYEVHEGHEGTPLSGEGDRSPSANGGGFDLDEYRRWQDRILGEREDEDDDDA